MKARTKNPRTTFLRNPVAGSTRLQTALRLCGATFNALTKNVICAPE
ncbi:MAG TPA: hypothetical protein VNQ80_09295 [Parapedobacter sp.]|nr:hypothetical protein [Parapedobacter sp.]HWK57521.1 hypothetical protein [Parapedobacter sp.]